MRWSFTPILLLVVGVLALQASCGDGWTSPEDAAVATPPEDPAVGQYFLQRLNGSQLPFRIAEMGKLGRAEVSAGYITLNADSTFEASFTFKTTVNDVVTIQAESTKGTWTKTDGTIHVAAEDWQDSGSWTGNTLLIQADGMVCLYER